MRKHISREKELETLIVLAAALLAGFLIFHKPFLVFLSLALLLVGLFSDKAARVLAGMWLKFSEILGGFNTKIILLLVYYLVLTPVAFLSRLTRKKRLNSPSDRSLGTYFVVREHSFSKPDIEKMW